MGNPRFTEEDLYRGRDDLPRSRDIDQDSFNNCYFVSPMGALADRQPERIRDAISYDAASGSFRVRLYEADGAGAKPVTIEVTQDEIRDNLKRGGGSTVDNAFLGLRDSPIWPAVIETAYAKQADANPQDGLAEGYANREWGHPRDAMFALTGDRGQDLGGAVGQPIGTEALGERIRGALEQGRPVTLGTLPEPGTKQDGLLDAHAYMVQGVSTDKNGETILRLRNPLGDNRGAGEGRDTGRAEIEVNLREVVDAGGFYGVNIGPAPQAPPSQGQQPGSGAGTGGIGTGDGRMDALLSSLDDPAAFRRELANLASSVDGHAFRAEGRLQRQEEQAAGIGPEPAAPPPVQGAEHAPEHAPRAMRL